MTDQVKILTVAVGAAALVGAYAVHWWWRRRLPRKWRKVGELVELTCFPIKSCGPINLESSECEILGLRKGYLRDRVFLVVNDNGKFLTARQHPEMTVIFPKLEEDVLTLEAPGMKESIKINISKLLEQPRKKAKCWENIFNVIDCGDEAANWLARYMTNGADIKPRLVYYPKDYTTHNVRPSNRPFKKLLRKDLGAFSDASSYNLLSESSLVDLNTRLSHPVKALSFRPNFVVRGSKVYEEDTWDYVRIGNTVFRNVRPCTRCTLTTVNPETGIRNEYMEPLKTLKMYRQTTDPEVKKWVAESPVMGIHLVLCSKGSVKLGDEVYVSVA